MRGLHDTGGRMLDSIILYYIKITLKSHIWRKKYNFVIIIGAMDVITFPEHM